MLLRRQEEATIHDLIDSHRSNIAKAGVALAEAIAEATTAYSLAIAASEAELEVQLGRRIALIHGPAEPAKTPVEAPPEASKPYAVPLDESELDVGAP